MAWVTHQQLANMCSLAGPSDWSALPWGNGKGMKGMGWDQAKGKAQGKWETGKKGKHGKADGKASKGNGGAECA